MLHRPFLISLLATLASASLVTGCRDWVDDMVGDSATALPEEPKSGGASTEADDGAKPAPSPAAKKEAPAMAPLSRQAEAAEPSQPTADANDEDEADAEEEEGVATKPWPKRARRRHREDAAEAKAERAEAKPSESDASPPDGQVASLAIKRLVLATGVSGREPVGAAASFVAGAQPKVYAFLEVQNPSRVASHVTVTFVPLAGGAPTGIRVEVGAATRWRTWATSRHVKTPGPWQVVVRDAEGTVLARQAFEVTPGIPTDTNKPDAA